MNNYVRYNDSCKAVENYLSEKIHDCLDTIKDEIKYAKLLFAQHESLWS